VWELLLETARQLAPRIGASGLHILFPNRGEQQFLADRQLLQRHDCQYHWPNRDYRDFDQFLATLVSRKRKRIRQERRKVADAGVRLRRLDGHSASHSDWQHFTDFYNITFERKWGMATFNLGFFLEVAERLPDRVLLVLADLDGDCLAGSLMYHSDTTLYGRHWGCRRQLDGLHFEACYYQGIEFAIERGLRLFEPGAQGEHKVARGFLPSRTCSSHWLVDERFRQPIADYVAQERAAVAEYMCELDARLPYRKESE
jgi:predicted N-acyltransferase